MKKKERMGFISLCIFLILSAFVVVCLENGLIIHAEETQTLGEVFDFYPSDSLSVTGYTNSDIYDSGVSLLYYNTNSIDVSFLSDYVLPSGYDYSRYTKVVASTNQNMEDFTIILLGENSYFLRVGNYCGIISLIEQGTRPVSDDILFIHYTGNNTVTVDSPSYSYLKNNVSYAYAGYYFNTSTNNWIVSNTDLYGLNSSYIDPSWGSFNLQDYFEMFAAYRFNETGPHEAVVNMYPNINYDPVGANDYSSIFDSTTLFDGSVMYITNTTFNDGTFYIYPVFNNTQKDNMDNFKLRLVGSCQYVCHKEDGLDKQIMKYNNVWLSTYYGIPASGKTFSCSLRSENGNYWDIPFSSISGGVYSAKLSAINNAMYYSGGDYPIEGLASCLSSYYGSYFVPFTQALNHVASNITGGSLPVASENGNVTITGCTYHFDLYVVSTVNGEDIISDSPVMNYDIDMINGSINGTSFDNLTNIDDLNDAYDNNVPQSSYPSSSPSTNYGGSFNNYDNTTTNPSGGGGGGSSSSSGGSVVNNNSDTLTINGNGDVARDIVNDLIPSDGVGGFTEQIEQTLQANSWMQVVRSTFAFIPTAVFTQISLYIITVLGILAAAFVLRIILDLL